MFSRVRVALATALLLSLITSITVFAKGGFSFITITGPDLKGEVRVTDTALTAGFFAFANFFEDRIEEPANPGVGYQVTRYYGSHTVFDQLHYYPEKGYVFYDGIVNGKSEYDGEWYIAQPGMADMFADALLVHTRSSVKILDSKTANVGGQVGAVADQNQLLMNILISAGFMAALLLIYRSRRQVAR